MMTGFYLVGHSMPCQAALDDEEIFVSGHDFSRAVASFYFFLGL